MRNFNVYQRTIDRNLKENKKEILKECNFTGIIKFRNIWLYYTSWLVRMGINGNWASENSV